MIHVAYGTGNLYAKFAGTSMLSIFENTTSDVTVHILHDNTLTNDNRDKFSWMPVATISAWNFIMSRKFAPTKFLISKVKFQRILLRGSALRRCSECSFPKLFPPPFPKSFTLIPTRF